MKYKKYKVKANNRTVYRTNSLIKAFIYNIFAKIIAPVEEWSTNIWN